MKVRDIMTKNVSCLGPQSKVIEAAQIMQQQNIGSVPICDSNGVLGIVTDRDIIVRNVAHGNNAYDTPLQDIMTTQVTTVEPDANVRDIGEQMSEEQIRRVPVVENNQVVGMVALGDLATKNRFRMEASKALTEISK